MLALFSSSAAFLAPASPLRDAVAARQSSPRIVLTPIMGAVGEPRTIEEGKNDFQKSWGEGFVGGWGDGTAPLPMSTQAFVNELITTVTIAMTSDNYQYSPIFGVGFELLVDMYALELREGAARERMRVALAKACLTDPAQMKEDSDALIAAAEGAADVEALFATPAFQELAGKDGKFKYTYVFGAGLITLMQKTGADPDKAVAEWCQKLNLSCEGQFTRDYKYFKAQLEKLQGMKDMMAQMKESAEKKAAKAAADTAAGIESKDPRKVANLGKEA